MKLIFALFIFAYAPLSQAHQIEWVRHSFHGVEQILLRLDGDGKTNRLFSNTNYLSVQKPLRIGLFDRKFSGPSLTQLKDIALHTADLKNIKPVLASPHTPKIFFDSIAVPAGSSFYSQIEKILEEEFKATTWSFVDGDEVQFTNSTKLNVSTWKTNKPLYKKTLDARQACKRHLNENVCIVPAGYIHAPAGFFEKILK